jgi:hypothetical protein
VEQTIATSQDYTFWLCVELLFNEIYHSTMVKDDSAMDTHFWNPTVGCWTSAVWRTTVRGSCFWTRSLWCVKIIDDYWCKDYYEKTANSFSFFFLMKNVSDLKSIWHRWNQQTTELSCHISFLLRIHRRARLFSFPVSGFDLLFLFRLGITNKLLKNEWSFGENRGYRSRGMIAKLDTFI